MTVKSPIVLRIRLKSSDKPKAMDALEISSTKTTSSAFCPSSKAACPVSSEHKKRPPGVSKDMRRERNRITARESRDRKAAYIAQLEMDVKRLNERVAQLEYDLTTRSLMNSNCNNHLFNSSFEEDQMLQSSSSLLQMSHQHMGFF